MDKTYNPADIEQKWYEHWEASGFYAPRDQGDAYCIMLPPPNVTGSLHMGHGFQHTLMDALARHQRMLGKQVLWQPGTDHAGISTQMVVERQLSAQGQSRLDFSREDFVQRIWDWKAQSGGQITEQMRRLGSSVDWSRERFTLDEGLSAAVRKVFVQLFDEGLIYRGKRLVNWDPKFLTAISDLEVLSEEEIGKLWTIQYPLENQTGHIAIATTRPETMLGDVALAVHPDDKRYQHLIGHMVKLPLTDRLIPIIADDMVAPEFGTGCVKITPAHDFNDYAIGQRHKLPMINILTPDCKLNENAPKKYQNLDRFRAREIILKDLDNLNYLIQSEDHKLKIPRGEKSGEIIEPMLTDQWFVKIAPLAKPALKAVESGEIKFIPENWTKTYNQWLENIEDWCISRQLWWGHRIPAYYDDAGNIYAGENEKHVREKYQLEDSVELHQDEDVLDTWFSSALWPFSTLGWPQKTPAFKTFYPTQLLLTGFDIIFFWVARMIMFGLKFTGQVPFNEVYITGLIRDAHGQKMSKSKGNVIDPIDVIDGIDLQSLIKKRTQGLMLDSQKQKIINNTKEEFPQGINAYGTDALRFTYCAMAVQGRNIRFDTARVAGYRNFCNKLWNAARFVFMHCAEEAKDLGDGPVEYTTADIWIRSRLQQTIKDSEQYFKTYRFDLLAQSYYDFVWHNFCDWYLELVKPVLTDDTVSAAIRRGTQTTLLMTLETCLRLLHPIMPFITEEIWQQIAKIIGISDDSIMTQTYPKFDINQIDNSIEQEVQWLQQFIITLRTLRAELQIPPSKFIDIYCQQGEPQDKINLEKYSDLILTLAKCQNITWLAQNKTPPPAATGLAGKLEILLPLKGLIDKSAESQRLQKEIDKLIKEQARIENKVNNKNFTDKAPTEVVEKEKTKLMAVKQSQIQLQARLLMIEAL